MGKHIEGDDIRDAKTTFNKLPEIPFQRIKTTGNIDEPHGAF
tara:strand:+ start:643 stop:768 length:126 start_codon:yes stop_codon:yes gene_type:complete